MGDYWGIRPDCGCITAWMAGDDVTDAEVREFYRNMADTGREVRRLAFTEETRAKIMRCPHHRESETMVEVMPVSEHEAEIARLRAALERIANQPASVPFGETWTHWCEIARSALSEPASEGSGK